jgi:hypothetical protein
MTDTEPAPGAAEATPETRPPSHDKAVVTAVVSIAVILVLGLLIAYFGIKFFSGNQHPSAVTREHNGFVFTKLANSWSTQWERDNLTYTLEFRHPPWEVENITETGQVDMRFQTPYMYITYDPTEGLSRETSFVALAAADLAEMLKGIFLKKNVTAVCTQNLTDACASRPIITCKNTNSSVIYLKVSDETAIILDGNCMTIEGKEEEMTRAADKALYQWLGII